MKNEILWGEDVNSQRAQYRNMVTTICEDLNLSGAIRLTSAPTYVWQTCEDFRHSNGESYWFLVEIADSNAAPASGFDLSQSFKIGFAKLKAYIISVKGSQELLVDLQHPLSINRLKSFIKGLNLTETTKPEETMDITLQFDEPRPKIVGYSKDAPFHKGRGYVLWEIPSKNGVKLFKEPMTAFLRDHLK